MSAAPSSRAEFTDAVRRLIAIFHRNAKTNTRKILERMDNELRYGDAEVFDHTYQRYLFWQKRNSFDSAAVRLAEGELYGDVEHAIEHGVSVVEAMEARARERSGS